MKRILIYMGLVLTIRIGLTSCYKDIIVRKLEKDPDGPPQAVSFKTELALLFNTSCALAGCHVSGGHKPYMATDISYLQIVNDGFVNTALPKESTLYKMINGEMQQ